MGIKKYNPTSPGRRFQTVSDFSDITKDTPFKPHLRPIKKTGGRNNSGCVTAWHRGGGEKRVFRVIDFKREKIGVPAEVETIEYDPNRSARIALLQYRDGDRRYIIAPMGLNVGDKILSGEVRIIPSGCMVTIGQGSNPDHENISFGKAGRKRRLGKKPHVRGVAMNPVDHPLGGGEGK